MLSKVGAFHDIITEIRATGDFELTYAVLGGVPQRWKRLADAWQDKGWQDITGITEAACEEALDIAAGHLQSATLADPRMEALCEKSKTQEVLTFVDLKAFGMPEPGGTLSPGNNVLRAVRKLGHGKVLVPATSAGSGNPPSLEKLRKVLAESSEPCNTLGMQS